MNNVRAIQKLNDLELKLGVGGSWHDEFKHSAYIAVGGLPFDLTEGDLRVVFSQYGRIVDINLIRDKTTGKSRGFGFLAYEDQRSTVLAVDNFNGANLLGRTLKVDHCKDYKPPKKDEKDGEGRKGADAFGDWKHDRFDSQDPKQRPRAEKRDASPPRRPPPGGDLSPPRHRMAPRSSPSRAAADPGDLSPRRRGGDRRDVDAGISPPRRRPISPTQRGSISSAARKSSPPSRFSARASSPPSPRRRSSQRSPVSSRGSPRRPRTSPSPARTRNPDRSRSPPRQRRNSRSSSPRDRR